MHLLAKIYKAMSQKEVKLKCILLAYSDYFIVLCVELFCLQKQ